MRGADRRDQGGVRFFCLELLDDLGDRVRHLSLELRLAPCLHPAVVVFRDHVVMTKDLLQLLHDPLGRSGITFRKIKRLLNLDTSITGAGPGKLVRPENLGLDQLGGHALKRRLPLLDRHRGKRPEPFRSGDERLNGLRALFSKKVVQVPLAVLGLGPRLADSLVGIAVRQVSGLGLYFANSLVGLAVGQAPGLGLYLVNLVPLAAQVASEVTKKRVGFAARQVTGPEPYLADSLFGLSFRQVPLVPLDAGAHLAHVVPLAAQVAAEITEGLVGRAAGEVPVTDERDVLDAVPQLDAAQAG